MVVKFSAANTKLKKLYQVESLKPYLEGKKKIYSFDLLSGWSCPAAKDCFSRAVQTAKGRRIQDGPDTQWRCFSASQEVVYTNVYNMRKRNFDTLRDCTNVNDMAVLINRALPKNAGIIRIHVAGDFFNSTYFKAWVKVAQWNPYILFYAYTKQLKVWVENANIVPENLVLTASYGGRYDSMIQENDLRFAKVVENESQAELMGVEVDNDDSHAADPMKRYESFALVIHGVQPKGRKKLQPEMALWA